MRKITNKRYKKGGDISNQNGLRHILSIGYEIECANLMKWKEDLLRIDLVINEASASIKDDETGKSKYKGGFTVPDSIRQRFKKKRNK